jgi:hypothetical protein
MHLRGRKAGSNSGGATSKHVELAVYLISWSKKHGCSAEHFQSLDVIEVIERQATLASASPDEI